MSDEELARALVCARAVLSMCDVRQAEELALEDHQAMMQQQRAEQQRVREAQARQQRASVQPRSMTR